MCTAFEFKEHKHNRKREHIKTLNIVTRWPIYNKNKQSTNHKTWLGSKVFNIHGAENYFLCQSHPKTFEQDGKLFFFLDKQAVY